MSTQTNCICRPGTMCTTADQCATLRRVEFGAPASSTSQHDTLPLEREQFKRDMKTLGERHGWSFGEGLEWDEARQDWGVSDMYTNWMWWAWLEGRAARATPAQAQQSDSVTPERAELCAAWNDLPDAIRCDPRVERLYRALRGANCEAQAQQAGEVVAWISVHDALPDGEPGDPDVLFYSDDLRNPVDTVVGIYRDGQWFSGGVEFVNVTHWATKPTAPGTTPPAPAQPAAQPFLVRDVAEMLGVDVPHVCKTLVSLGFAQKSTNMVITPDEAVAVAKAQPVQGVPDVDDLAQFIRKIDGNHRMGAGALAERIVEWLAASPTPPAQQPEAVPSEQARWCAYVGGMVAHWVKSEPDAHARLGDDKFEAAIAGIIERRMWALRRDPVPAQPAVAQGAGEVVAWTVAGEVTNWSRDFSKYRTQHYVRPLTYADTQPAAGADVPRLSEQDATLLAQAHDMLLELAEDQRSKGNDSAAMGAACSADAVLRMGEAASASVFVAEPVGLCGRGIKVAFLDGHVTQARGSTFSQCLVIAAYERLTKGGCTHRELWVDIDATKRLNDRPGASQPETVQRSECGDCSCSLQCGDTAAYRAELDEDIKAQVSPGPIIMFDEQLTGDLSDGIGEGPSGETGDHDEQ